MHRLYPIRITLDVKDQYKPSALIMYTESKTKQVKHNKGKMNS